MKNSAKEPATHETQSGLAKSPKFQDIMNGLEQIEKLDAKQVAWNSVYKKASLALTYLKNQ